MNFIEIRKIIEILERDLEVNSLSEKEIQEIREDMFPRIAGSTEKKGE